MNREPGLEELIGAEATGAERQRLQHAHELLLQAGPPPELSPELEAGPSLGMTLRRERRRRALKQRALVLLAAALTLVLVFFGGYAVANGGGGGSGAKPSALALAGTKFAPEAQATLQVWPSRAGNVPMTLDAVGLPKLPAHSYYEVYLVRNGKPWGSCGTFRVGPSGEVRVTLNAPYSLRKGDSWVVTRPGPDGAEPGPTVLRPVNA